MRVQTHRTTSTTRIKQTISSATQEASRYPSTCLPLLEVSELQVISPQLCPPPKIQENALLAPTLGIKY